MHGSAGIEIIYGLWTRSRGQERRNMKIIEVEYSELFSEGFNNRKVGVPRALVEKNETPVEALIKLKKWVREQLGKKETLTHYQKVQIAKEIILETERNEIPF